MEERRRRFAPDAQDARNAPPTEEKLESFREKMRQRAERSPLGKAAAFKHRNLEARRAPPKPQEAA